MKEKRKKRKEEREIKTGRKKRKKEKGRKKRKDCQWHKFTFHITTKHTVSELYKQLITSTTNAQMFSEQALCTQWRCLQSSVYGNHYVTRISVWCTNISSSHFIKNTHKNVQWGIFCTSDILKGKGKVILLQAQCGPEGG